jgi:hypothetical protein
MFLPNIHIFWQMPKVLIMAVSREVSRVSANTPFLNPSRALFCLGYYHEERKKRGAKKEVKRG